MPINSGYGFRSIKDPQTTLRGFNLITGVIIDKRSTVPITLKKYYQLHKKSSVKVFWRYEPTLIKTCVSKGASDNFGAPLMLLQILLRIPLHID